MNDLRKSIKKLLTLKKNEKFLVNGEYECTIKNGRTFSSFIKNENCPAYNSYAMIKVAGHDMLAKIDVMWHLDLETDLSCDLCFYENKNELVSMITVTKIEFL